MVPNRNTIMRKKLRRGQAGVKARVTSTTSRHRRAVKVSGGGSRGGSNGRGGHDGPIPGLSRDSQLLPTGQVVLTGINTRRETVNTGLSLLDTKTSDTPSLRPLQEQHKLAAILLLLLLLLLLLYY